MTETPPRIVLDTNVLYAGLYSASGRSYQLLKAIAEGKARVALSTPLLFEYEDVLKRNQVRKAAGHVIHRLDAHRSLLRDNADVVGAQCLANVARPRDLPLAGDLGDVYNGAHTLLCSVCFTEQHRTAIAKSSN